MGRSRSAAPKRSSSPPARAASTHSAPPPKASPPAHAPPPAAPPAPMQQQQGGGMLSGLGATIAQGFAFGTGSAIAHRAVGAVADSFSGGGDKAPAPQQTAPQPPSYATAPSSTSSDKCDMDLQAFNNCMKDNKGSVQACDFYFQALQQCQNSSY